jgi:hypothetical protein
MIIRKCLHAARDRFFKYRILKGDIFCNQRMVKFKMVSSPICTFCNQDQIVESIKHLIWDCPRSKSVWDTLEELIRATYNRSYITYESIIIGNEQFIPLVENLIVIALKLIIAKDRSGPVSREQLISKIKTFYFIEKQAFQKKNLKFDRRWALLERTLFSFQ